MSWTEITRRQYRRDGLRYASDLSEEEWQSIAPHLPVAKPLGRPRETDLREAVNAMLYVLTTGCLAPPAHGLPALYHGAAVLLPLARRRHVAADQPSPGAGCPRGDGSRGQPVGGGDRQPVGQDDGSGRAARLRRGPRRSYRPPRRALAARRIDGSAVDGRKRHILTDTNGLLVAATVHEADVQDRDGAVPLLASVRRPFPWLRHVFADGGYAGAKLETALAALGSWTLEIVKRSDTAQGFELLPRSWVVV